jgi:hypothetical protein
MGIEVMSDTPRVDAQRRLSDLDPDGWPSIYANMSLLSEDLEIELTASNKRIAELEAENAKLKEDAARKEGDWK